MQCPGQDTRFWKPDAVFDVPCQACGHLVEFFKTDARRRCPKCGKRIQNPRISLGCARWCAHAKECLGFDPQALELADSAELSLTDRLVAAVKAEFGGGQERVTHSLLVLDQAQDLLRREGGDPRVVLAAALLHDIGMAVAEVHHEDEGPPAARRIMEEAGFDETTIEQVCGIVGSHRRGGLDTLEARIVWDADRLVEVPEELRRVAPERRGEAVVAVLRTASGRQKALQLLDSRGVDQGKDGSDPRLMVTGDGAQTQG